MNFFGNTFFPFPSGTILILHKTPTQPTGDFTSYSPISHDQSSTPHPSPCRHSHPFLTPGLQLEVLVLLVASLPIVSLTLISPRGWDNPYPLPFLNFFHIFLYAGHKLVQKWAYFSPGLFLSYYTSQALLGSPVLLPTSPSPTTHAYAQTHTSHNILRKDTLLLQSQHCVLVPPCFSEQAWFSISGPSISYLPLES